MRAFIAAALLAALAAAGCALPEMRGPVRQCIPDSGVCWFTDRDEARR